MVPCIDALAVSHVDEASLRELFFPLMKYGTILSV